MSTKSSEIDVEDILRSIKIGSIKNGINNPNFENETNSNSNNKSGNIENSKTIKYFLKFSNNNNNNDTQQQQQTISTIIINNKDEKCNKNDDSIILRDLISYYLLGLCNNFGFFVMLSAANDIMDGFDDREKLTIPDTGRICHLLSTGTILLADVIPGLIVKIIVPFLPFYINVRVFIAVTLAAIGYLIVGISETEFCTILGIVMTSASACLGESTFLSYSSNYNKNVVAAWSAGGAGIAGSLSYAALRSLNISQRSTILLMLIIPIIECLIFWILLRHPQKNIEKSSINNNNNNNKNDNNIKTTIINQLTEYDNNNIDEKPLITLFDKIKYLNYLLKYMLPLMIIYFAQYFINQGLFQLVYFENIFLDKSSQYRWLIVNYQIGVFIARSTVSLFSIKPIWIMSILQLINVIYFLIEVIYYITPNIWITFIIVFWEGLLGGGGYAYTFYNISNDIQNDRKRIAMGIVSISDTIGITIAGFAAISIHNIICSIPAPIRY